jgi:hypothetical protein
LFFSLPIPFIILLYAFLLSLSPFPSEEMITERVKGEKACISLNRIWKESRRRVERLERSKIYS